MAWTEQLSSGKWRGGYRVKGKKYYHPDGPFNTKSEALRKANAKEEDARQPQALAPNAGQLKFGPWFEAWYSAHEGVSATLRSWRSTADLHLLPYWEDTELGDIDLVDGKKWVKRLQKEPRTGAKKPRTPWTIRLAVQLMSAVLNGAVENRKLPSNPFKTLSWPDLPKTPDRYLTPEEVERLAFFMDDFNELILWTDVTTGLRAGELGGLHATRVDFDRGGLWVVETFDQHDKVINPVPKDKEQRWVPLEPDVARDLQEYVGKLPKQKTCGVPHLSGKCPGGALVFSGPRHAPFQSRDWRRGPFARALREAKIEGRVRFHDLRHTYASWLIQTGVTLPEIALVMGHSSFEVTKRYAHLSDESYETVRAALSVKSGRGARAGAVVPLQAATESLAS